MLIPPGKGSPAVVLELQQSLGLLPWGWSCCSVLSGSWTVPLQRFICVHLCWSAALHEAKRVCLMQDTATTAKQSVRQASQEIPYSSLFGMQSCLPASQQLCNSCWKLWQKGHSLG